MFPRKNGRRPGWPELFISPLEPAAPTIPPDLINASPKLEIERKYLLSPQVLLRLLSEYGLEPITIWQGYLIRTSDWELRVRLYRHEKAEPSSYVEVRGEQYSGASVTRKTGSGLVREEDEQLSTIQAGVLLYGCCVHTLRKTRYQVDGWAIDVYQGPLEGLVVGEYELTSETQDVPFPRLFSGMQVQEVTGDKAYSNASLAEFGWPSEK